MRSIPTLQNSAQITTVPSPVGGLNAYNNLAAMPPTDAVRMLNFVPTSFGCNVRKGYQKYATGMGIVSSILPYNAIDGTHKLFAFGNNKLYDISLPGPVGAPLLTGLVNDYWQGVNFANSAGVHLVAANGADNPIWYRASVGLQRLTAGNGTDSGTWSGVDPKTLIQFTIHQRRLWAVQVNSTLGWFLPADSVYGVANFFDFGPFFKQGGYLAGLGTWSADVGSGSDDMLVALSSEGEAVVFAGTNVADSNSWKLRGVYYIGSPPSGRRFMTNVAGDLMILTKVGVVSMATVLTSTTVNVSSDTAYSKKVQYLLNELLANYSSLPGWEIKFFPATNLLYINIPSIYYGGNGQLVSNYVNTSWTTFSNMNATCWANSTFGQFFGDVDGTVYQAWVGFKDKVELDGSGGTSILAACQQAYSNFGAPAAQKQIGMFKPVFLAAKRTGVAAKLIYDYVTSPDLYPSTSGSQIAGSYWDTSRWDVGRWAGDAVQQLDWYSAEGIGVAASLTMTLSVLDDTTWVATDYVYKSGGAL